MQSTGRSILPLPDWPGREKSFIQFPGNSFDVIICNHVLEHIPDDHKAMSELFRVLKPNGWAILQTPMDTRRETTFEDPTATTPQQREQLFGQSDHVRIYGRDYKDRLEATGFTVTVDDFVKTLPPETVSRFGLMADEDIYLCKKPGDA